MCLSRFQGCLGTGARCRALEAWLRSFLSSSSLLSSEFAGRWLAGKAVPVCKFRGMSAPSPPEHPAPHRLQYRLQDVRMEIAVAHDPPPSSFSSCRVTQEDGCQNQTPGRLDLSCSGKRKGALIAGEAQYQLPSTARVWHAGTEIHPPSPPRPPPPHHMTPYSATCAWAQQDARNPVAFVHNMGFLSDRSLDVLPRCCHCVIGGPLCPLRHRFLRTRVGNRGPADGAMLEAAM